MKLPAVAMVLLLGTGPVLAQEAAAFGYIQEVVLEPSAEAPQKVQLWGTFSVAAREAGAYQTPEDGYLYFALPKQDADKARAEWRKLAEWPKAKIAALSRRGEVLRVRTDGEQTTAPDPYEAGWAPDRDGEGARLLREVPKNGVRHYAMVDRVEAEPSAEAPKEVRIWGTFSLEGQVRRGYIYFALAAGKGWAGTLKKWSDVARTGRPVAFYTERGAGELRVRPEDESFWEPDRVRVLNVVLPVRTDTWYRPVRQLIGGKCAYTLCY